MTEIFATGEPQPADGEEAEYEMVMPFVLVKSEGGPYDDAAFVAGATIGALEQEFAMCEKMQATPRRRYINAKYMPQVDLIAMRHGYTVELGELDEPSGWQLVTFV